MKRSPTMVFAGSFWPGGTERGLADGFRSLGWAVQEVDRRDYNVSAGRGIVARFANNALRSTASQSYWQKVLASCQALKPDLFFTVKGVGISGDLLRRVKEVGVRTVMYYPDRDFQHPGLLQDSFGEYDLFITTKKFQNEYLEVLLRKQKIGYVPHGYVASVHRPIFDYVGEKDYQADLLYPGNHSSYKQKWLEGALARLPKLSVKIIGNRWRENAATKVLSGCEMPGERIGIAYAEAIQRARINVAVHFGPAPNGWEDLVSTRTFEIPACKGFMLHIDNEEVREFFKPGEEIDVFSTPEELADKIRFYLARPELREKMIERAYTRAVPAYSYIARATALDGLFWERLSGVGKSS